MQNSVDWTKVLSNVIVIFINSLMVRIRIGVQETIVSADMLSYIKMGRIHLK